jgi:hypothetical protein
MVTVAGDGVSVSGLWWKPTSAVEATPAVTARPPSVAMIGLVRRGPPTSWCRGVIGDGWIGFTVIPSVESRVLCACVYAGVIGLGELGCSGRRIGPRDRMWWSSSNATAIADPVVLVTAVVTARHWATWPLSSPAVPARKIAGERVVRAG